MDYIAYLHKDRKSDFGVSFPDFPGCITAGRTLEEARRRAAEALSFHIAGMIEDGEKVPNPSPEQLKSLHAIVDDVFGEISLEDIIKDVVPVYQRHLTKTDVSALVTFYSSPVGQKVLREQSAMVRESMEATAAGQQRKMESLMARLELRVQQLALEEQNKNATDKK